MNDCKEIIVNKEGTTNVERIFAAGDCTDTEFNYLMRK